MGHKGNSTSNITDIVAITSDQKDFTAGQSHNGSNNEAPLCQHESKWFSIISDRLTGVIVLDNPVPHIFG